MFWTGMGWLNGDPDIPDFDERTEDESFSCNEYNDDFEYDPLFCFDKIKFERIVYQTEKAYLFKTKDGSFWVPKALVKELERKSCYILTDFEINYLEK